MKDNWREFCEMARGYLKEKQPSPYPQVEQDMWYVLLAYFGASDIAKKWINSNVPVLDNKRPIDFFATEKGKEQVKKIIMRLP